MLDYSLEAYLTRAEMYERISLVVEGDSDEYFYDLLLSSPGALKGLSDRIDVHAVARLNLTELSSLATWEKVEEIGRQASIASSTRVFAVTDRMFRLFEVAPSGISDHQTSLVQNSHLAWTSGHSIENYLLYPSLFRSVLQPLVGRVNHRALSLFDQHFGAVLRAAVELTMAVRQTAQKHPVGQLTSDIAGKVCWQWFCRSEDGIGLLAEEVGRTLRAHQRPYADSFENAILENRQTVKATSLEVLRAFCHSHLSEAVMWNAFAFCLFDQTDGDLTAKKKAVDRLYDSSVEIRRRQLMEALVQKEQRIVEPIIGSLRQLFSPPAGRHVAAT